MRGADTGDRDWGSAKDQRVMVLVRGPWQYLDSRDCTHRQELVSLHSVHPSKSWMLHSGKFRHLLPPENLDLAPHLLTLCAPPP